MIENTIGFGHNDLIYSMLITWGSIKLYELVRKCVYLYVGRGIDGQTKVAWAIDGRTKDVVPIIYDMNMYIQWHRDH